MSKGSKRRPAAVPRAELERRWERAFGGEEHEPWPPATPENMAAAQREKNRLLAESIERRIIADVRKDSPTMEVLDRALGPEPTPEPTRTWWKDNGRSACPDCDEPSVSATAYAARDSDGAYRRYVNGWRCQNGHQWETPTASSGYPATPGRCVECGGADDRTKNGYLSCGECGAGLPGLERDPMLDEAQQIIAAERERYLGMVEVDASEITAGPVEWPDNGIRARITDITAPE